MTRSLKAQTPVALVAAAILLTSSSGFAAKAHRPRYVSARVYHQLMRAELYRMVGARNSAVEALREALVYDPDSADLHLELAELYSTRRSARAELVERALKLDPKSSRAWLLRGLVEPRASMALRAYRRAQKLSAVGTEDWRRAVLARARRLFDDGRDVAARRVLRTALKRHRSGVVMLELAWQELLANQLEESRAALKQADELVHGRALIDLASVQTFVGDYPAALRSIARSPWSPRPADRRAMLRVLLRAEAPKRARRQLELLAREDCRLDGCAALFGEEGYPGVALELLEPAPAGIAKAALRARLLLRAGRTKESLQVSRTLGGTAGRLLEARALEAKGRLTQALEVCRVEPRALDLRLEEIRILSRLGRKEEAVGKLAPMESAEDTETLTRVALMYGELGLAARGRDVASAALRIDPSNFRAQRAETLLDLSVGGGSHDAERALRSLVRRAPDDATLVRALGARYRSHGWSELGELLGRHAALLDRRGSL